MDKNNQDIFDEFEKTNMKRNEENNFFLSGDSLFKNTPQVLFSDPIRRLNDYDSNLLQEDAYKEINDEMFKLEYKIAKIEEELKDLEVQLKTAQEIQDAELVQEIETRQAILKADYKILITNYNERSLSGKISDSIFSVFNKKKNKVQSKNLSLKFSKISELILSKLPKSLLSLMELKKSLSQLENINKSVDDLMSLKIPYGENLNKYEQLSKYIIKANSIQMKISQNIKKH